MNTLSLHFYSYHLFVVYGELVTSLTLIVLIITFSKEKGIKSEVLVECGMEITTTMGHLDTFTYSLGFTICMFVVIKLKFSYQHKKAKHFYIPPFTTYFGTVVECPLRQLFTLWTINQHPNDLLINVLDCSPLESVWNRD